jgi:hypothetical protein
VTEEKWQKGKNLVKSWVDAIKLNDGIIDYKSFKRVRGFLCHLSMTFEVITPFLKDFHLILANHLPRHDEDGWKFSEKGYLAYVHQKLVTMKSPRHNRKPCWRQPRRKAPPPKTLLATERFKQDLFALGGILRPASPPDGLIRSNTVLQILYGFGDASGKGFGSTMLSSQGIQF